MKLPAAFIKNIQSTYGEEGNEWLNNLSSHLEKLSSKWNFQIINIVIDISYNYVAVVRMQSGLLAILKTAPPSAKLIAEAEWIKAHKKSVPTIFHIDNENNAYIMEKLNPGTSLKYCVKEKGDEKATRILAQTILDLQSTNVLHPINYQHISEHAFYFSLLRGHLDSNIIDCGVSLFNDLSKACSNDIVLHGDLHHDNILQSDSTWSVIDPHGYIGDPCAEVGPMIYNPLDCFPDHMPMKNIIESRLNILAEMLPFDLKHIKAWAFCLALRSAAWDVEGFSKPNNHTIRVAKILFNIL